MDRAIEFFTLAKKLLKPNPQEQDQQRPKYMRNA